MERLSEWKSRYTVREFDSNKIPKKEDMDYLMDVIPYIPTQESREETIWLTLGPEEKHIKKWIFDNIFFCYVQDNEPEHMYAVSSAPYVFLNCVLEAFSDYEAFKMQGIQGGVLLTESLKMGYDCSLIGCKDHDFFKDKDRFDQFKNLVFDHFGMSEFEKYGVTGVDSRLHPSLCVCVGTGLPYKNEKNYLNNYELREEKRVYLGGKPKRKMSGVISKS